MLKFKLEATSISSTVHVRRPFSKFQKRYGLLNRLDFVNFDGFRFLDPPVVGAPGEFHHPGLGLGLRFLGLQLALGLGLGIGIGLGTGVVKFSGSAPIVNLFQTNMNE